MRACVSVRACISFTSPSLVFTESPSVTVGGEHNPTSSATYSMLMCTCVHTSHSRLLLWLSQSHHLWQLVWNTSQQQLHTVCGCVCICACLCMPFTSPSLVVIVSPSSTAGGEHKPTTSATYSMLMCVYICVCVYMCACIQCYWTREQIFRKFGFMRITFVWEAIKFSNFAGLYLHPYSTSTEVYVNLLVNHRNVWFFKVSWLAKKVRLNSGEFFGVKVRNLHKQKYT